MEHGFELSLPQLLLLVCVVVEYSPQDPSTNIPMGVVVVNVEKRELVE
jgi:hypothetical protein